MKEQTTAPTSVRRWITRIAASLAVALLLAMTVKATLAEAYVAANDTVAPEITAGSRFLVCKVCHSLEVGDIVVYREDDESLTGRVIARDEATGQVTLQKNGLAPVVVEEALIEGRVVAQLR